MAVEAKELAARLRGGTNNACCLECDYSMLLAEAVEKYAYHAPLSWCAVGYPGEKCDCGYQDWLRRVAEATEGGEGRE